MPRSFSLFPPKFEGSAGSEFRSSSHSSIESGRRNYSKPIAEEGGHDLSVAPLHARTLQRDHF
jgi:hypothetical protein